jgi:hypothetical protein
MTFDVNVEIFHGYKVPLNLCFEKNIVNRDIIWSDDWQFINMEEDLDSLIDKHITSEHLTKFLKEGLWKLYFVCSTQSDINPSESWMIIYYDRQTITTGTPPDFITGQINSSSLYNTAQMTEDMCKLFDEDLSYSCHYAVESSW